MTVCLLKTEQYNVTMGLIQITNEIKTFNFVSSKALLSIGTSCFEKLIYNCPFLID
jgi:hypothetical protein